MKRNVVCKARLRGLNFEKCGGFTSEGSNKAKPRLSISISVYYLQNRRLLNGSLFGIQHTQFTLASGTAE
jgi:hypothetical protein